MISSRTTRGAGAVFALVVLCGVSWGAPAGVTPDSCAVLRKHGHKTEAQSCYEALTKDRSAYFRAEGYWGLEQYDNANEQFRLATQAPTGGSMERVRWGMLLHERFNNAEADGLFNEALERDPKNARAYLGLAIVSADGFDNKAAAYAGKALEQDPKLAEAHELLAQLALEDGDTKAALGEADAALAIAPDSLDAMAVHAAVELLADKSPDVWFGKIAAVNAGYGQGYALVARQLEMHYRYEDGIVYYRKAVETDPRLWSAHSALGIDLMRMGQEKEPLEQLELSYDNGYRDAATVNSLRLLDSYKNFVTFKDDTTILRMKKEEADLLRPYFDAELHKIIATYQKKYKMTLPAPVQLEVYPDHEDFAVRTMGMPGLGALGVTFGEVVAMDSPSARKPGDFNWGQTLWHEMSHVYILTMTNHRVPRWFTEGLAVHEEGQAAPEWADRLTPEVLAAIRQNELLPVEKLDRGFVFPDYPAQVVVSYFQAGTICDFIGSKWGEDKLLAMAHSYAQLKTTPEVIKADLGFTPDEFDTQYKAWLDKRVGKTAANFNEWRTKLKALVELDKAKDYDVILRDGPAIVVLYPEYVGDANAYEYMANAHLKKDDKKGATADLKAYEKMGGDDPGTLKKLAALEEELGDKAAAAATLNRINYIYPVRDEELHKHLGELWLAQGNYAGAIREDTAVVAMKPLDKAGAEFNLAQAYYAAGQKDKAEETVLASLESAPGYRPAQKLLLELEKPEAKKPAEYADNTVGTGQTVSKYPQSTMKADTLQNLMLTHSATDPAKALDEADRLLQIDPNNLRALTLEVYLRKAQAEPLTDAAAKQADYDAASDMAKKGLTAADNKPKDMGDADFAALKRNALPVFYGAIGTAALNKKDTATAIDSFKKELASVPVEATTTPGPILQDTYVLATAYYQSTPPDLLNCAFYAARAANFAPEPYKSQMLPLAKYCYKKFHGADDGFDAVTTAAVASLNPPATYASSIKPAPTPADIVANLIATTPDLSTLAVSDKEFILQNGKPKDAAKVWDTVKGKSVQFSDALVIAATGSSVQVAVSDDAVQSKTADFTFNTAAPLKKVPTSGSKVTIYGTYASFSPSPLMITMSDAEIVEPKNASDTNKK